MKTADANYTLSSVYTILRLTFGLVPIVAGLDKFTNLLTHWEDYLNPVVLNLLPVDGHIFMMIVGIIEIIAGIIVLSKPSVGAYIVMIWLICIVLNLITSGRFFDVAVRDLAMAISSFCLAKIAQVVPEKNIYIMCMCKQHNLKKAMIFFNYSIVNAASKDDMPMKLLKDLLNPDFSAVESKVDKMRYAKGVCCEIRGKKILP